MPGALGPVPHAALLPAALVLLLTGCEHRPVTEPSVAGPSFVRRVALPRFGVARHRAVELWLSRPLAEPRRPLIVHLTGDSGRHGLDLELFTALTRWGYPVALVSSPGWMNTVADRLGTPAGLARDIDLIARAAARETGVPERQPFVLLGQSRGAGLSVGAAGEPELRERLLGVVALGLCADETHLHRPDGWVFPYRDKVRLAELPLEVIQSTHDRFLSAGPARGLFGPNTEGQRFHAIEARSHTFVGARPELLDQLRESLERIARR